MKSKKNEQGTPAAKSSMRELSYQELQKVVGGASLGYTYSTAPTVKTNAVFGSRRILGS